MFDSLGYIVYPKVEDVGFRLGMLGLVLGSTAATGKDLNTDFKRSMCLLAM